MLSLCLRWRIGNGIKMAIYSDKWIPTLKEFIHLHTLATEDMKEWWLSLLILINVVG